jgi:DNA polymerase V
MTYISSGPVARVTIEGHCCTPSDQEVPVGTVAVSAGFPSPAEDYWEPLDLHRHLIPHPASTYLVRVTGCSMEGAGISDGDELVVDRAADAADGHIVVAVLDDGFVCKRLHQGRDGRWWLVAENPDYPDLPVTEDTVVWGVVHTVIHHV